MLAVHGDLVVLLGVKHHLLICPLGKLVVGSVIERIGVHLGLMTLVHVRGVGRGVLVESRVVGSVGGGPVCLLLLHRVGIRLLLEVERELLAGLLGHRGGMVDRIWGRGVLLPGRGLISGRRGIHSLRRCWKMPVLGSENSHGLGGEEKERSCISGVEARAYAKLEAKARRLVTTFTKKRCSGKVAEWKWQGGGKGKNPPGGVSEQWGVMARRFKQG